MSRTEPAVVARGRRPPWSSGRIGAIRGSVPGREGGDGLPIPAAAVVQHDASALDDPDLRHVFTLGDRASGVGSPVEGLVALIARAEGTPQVTNRFPAPVLGRARRARRLG